LQTFAVCTMEQLNGFAMGQTKVAAWSDDVDFFKRGRQSSVSDATTRRPSSCDKMVSVESVATGSNVSDASSEFDEFHPADDASDPFSQISPARCVAMPFGMPQMQFCGMPQTMTMPVQGMAPNGMAMMQTTCFQPMMMTPGGFLVQQPIIVLNPCNPVSMPATQEQSSQHKKPDADVSKGDGRTTVMVKNLPNAMTRDTFMELVNRLGFSGMYDFLYLPIDFECSANLGYAFINLTTPSVAVKFWKVFDGFSKWDGPSRKVCKIVWNEALQGVHEHVERFRNSPLMHPDVPDICRPLLLKNGARVAFPVATKTLRAPRLRKQKSRRQPFWNNASA